MLLHEKTMLEIWLSPGLSLTIFKEPDPDVFLNSYLFISKPWYRALIPHFCPPEIYRPNKELQKVMTGYLTHLTFLFKLVCFFCFRNSFIKCSNFFKFLVLFCVNNWCNTNLFHSSNHLFPEGSPAPVLSTCMQRSSFSLSCDTLQFIAR